MIREIGIATSTPVMLFTRNLRKMLKAIARKAIGTANNT
jgi:hypothetical protein